MTRAARPQGFTLIELLVSIAIMTTLAGLAIPGLYGSYQHQQMINTANEITSAINQAKFRALSNYQGQYAVPKSQGGPFATCDATHPYVDQYVFAIDPDQKGYTITQALRSGANCLNSPAPTPMLRGRFPTNIKVNQLGNPTKFPLTFKTTSGEFNIKNGETAYIELISDGGVLSNVTYYVCISANQLYVQKPHC